MSMFDPIETGKTIIMGHFFFLMKVKGFSL